MPVRGVRGATVVEQDMADQVIQATKELLLAILAENPGLNPRDVASCLFTVTHDLNSAFPAKAARDLGWADVPLMCAQEIPVPGGVPCCIRILLHWNTTIDQSDIVHVYLKDAVRLRPDLNLS